MLTTLREKEDRCRDDERLLDHGSTLAEGRRGLKRPESSLFFAPIEEKELLFLAHVPDEL